MLTFQDLEKVGNDDIARAKFCRKAVDEFKGTADYKNAADGEAYYNKHNLTIEKFQKMLYTLSGKEVPDVWSANYKLKTTFFRRLVQQQVQYVLGNGIVLGDVNNKLKLGADFDFKMISAAKRAMAAGRAFGFWNYDHLEIFGYADTPAEPGFCPLYSEKDSKLMAGIRFWYRKVGDKLILRTTLYEVDGYTEYQQKENEPPEVLAEKRAYKRTVKSTNAAGIEEVVDENYTDLPIVPIYANDSHESELVGIRECIDCYDFIKSGFANDIDDTSGFYWVLKNTGGMDDIDMAKFIQRMRSVRAAAVEGEEGATAEAHTFDVPVEATKTMLEILRNDIYEDFQSLDVKTLSAAAKTTQEIQAAYQAQDNKSADFEYFMLDFVQQILVLAGINDIPKVIWNRVVNQTEQTNMILSAANYLTEESIIKHLPFLTPEEADEIIKARKAEEYKQFNADDLDIAELLQVFADRGDEGIDMIKDFLAKKAGNIEEE